jgi:hypothetical protein
VRNGIKARADKTESRSDLSDKKWYSTLVWIGWEFARCAQALYCHLNWRQYKNEALQILE